LEKVLPFFDACLSPLGGKRAINHSGTSMYVNTKNGVFWIVTQSKSGLVDGAHYAFTAESTADVDAWYEAAIKAGGKDNGKPGPRPNYGPHFYGAYVHDPVDGIHLECCFKKYNVGTAPADTDKKESKPTLYYYWGTRSMRPLWMAQELGISLNLHHVDLSKKAQKNDEYTKYNPYGTVPTLVDGDDVLTNSVSSTLYLAQKYGGDKFVSKASDASEFVTSIDRFDDILIKAFLNKIIYPAEMRDANIVSANHATFTKMVLPHWNRMATKMGKFAIGDQFTVTDVVWGYLLNQAVSLEWITEKDHSKLHEYTLRLRERPAFKAVYDRSSPMYQH